MALLAIARTLAPLAPGLLTVAVLLREPLVPDVPSTTVDRYLARPRTIVRAPRPPAPEGVSTPGATSQGPSTPGATTRNDAR